MSVEAPRVSVVIPTIGRTEVLRAVASVRAGAGDAESEVIVVVDGSQPRADLLERLGSVADRVVRTGRKAGAAHARNLGVGIATGDWVAFLDDDDEWLPGHWDGVERFLSRSDQVDVVSCRIIYARPGEGDGKQMVPTRTLRGDEPVMEYLFVGRSADMGRPSLYTSTLTVRRELARAVRWTEGLRRHQDWDWIRRAERAGCRIGQSEHVGVRIWMDSEDSISASADWQASLAWARSWRSEESARVYVDFITGQSLRYALAARSARGAAAWLYECVRSRRVPTPATLVLGAGGLVPRALAIRVLSRRTGSAAGAVRSGNGGRS